MTSRSPLVNRLAVIIGAIVLTAIVSMATTLAVSNSIEGNATAINLAGSLRMGAFQLVARSATEDYRNGQRAILERIAEYEERLKAPAITRSLPGTDDHPLLQQYRRVNEQWTNQLRP
ncbi:MAG TPA: histidine kinase, partial [Marinobacter hydrocarbonoclasticus]|nr:histidine kinase [Marinobacter nauticus]